MKDTVLSIVRILLTAGGAYLIGQNVFGTTIDDNLWGEIGGALLALIGTIWGILDKKASIEQIQSGVRSIVAVIGGLLVASGKIKAEVLTAVLGIIAIIIPAVQSETSKKKIAQLESGKIGLADLKSSDKPAPKYAGSFGTEKEN